MSRDALVAGHEMAVERAAMYAELGRSAQSVAELDYYAELGTKAEQDAIRYGRELQAWDANSEAPIVDAIWEPVQEPCSWCCRTDCDGACEMVQHVDALLELEEAAFALANSTWEAFRWSSGALVHPEGQLESDVLFDLAGELGWEAAEAAR